MNRKMSVDVNETLKMALDVLVKVDDGSGNVGVQRDARAECVSLDNCSAPVGEWGLVRWVRVRAIASKRALGIDGVIIEVVR